MAGPPLPRTASATQSEDSPHRESWAETTTTTTTTCPIERETQNSHRERLNNIFSHRTSPLRVYRQKTSSPVPHSTTAKIIGRGWYHLSVRSQRGALGPVECEVEMRGCAAALTIAYNHTLLNQTRLILIAIHCYPNLHGLCEGYE